MPSFDARLRLPGQTRLPVNVVVDVSDERLRLNRGDHTLADWRIAGLDVNTLSDGFHIRFEEEEMVLTLSEPERFADELARVCKLAQPQITNGDREASVSPPLSLSSRLSSLDPEELFEDVKGRIAELRLAMGDDGVEPPVVFGRWMRLLKEINLRHGQGAMPTPIFYRLNTELLDLLPVPAMPRPIPQPVGV